jgi:hypothetical protein
MNTYQLQIDYQGMPKNTLLFGPLPLISSSKPAYFTKENLPLEGQYGTNGFFQSAVEGNASVFKNVTPSQSTKNPAL